MTKEHDAELIKLLTVHLPDMLWVKNLDGKYLYVNQAICDGLLMAKDTEEPIGKGDVFFALRERELHKEDKEWHTFGELCFNSDQVVIDNDKAMKFEEYGNVKGKLLYLEVNKAPFYDENGKTIGTVGTGRDITALKQTQLDLQESLKTLEYQREQLEYQANHDKLTGLPNRVLFLNKLMENIQSAKAQENILAVLFIDLDNFKEINDSLGHDVGDKVLVEVSRRMKEVMRSSDTLARLGGDEFAIIVNDLPNIENVSSIIQEGMQILTQPLSIENNILHISMSIGISIYPEDGENSNKLVKNADAAMYKAKHNGRNRYCYYNEEMTKKAYERVFLETELRKALKKDDLLVYFQPQIDAKDNTIVGMEALVRWNHEDRGMIFPDTFIPLAEVTGMIVELDRLVMRKAIAAFTQWHEAGLNPRKISLNLAIKQIEEEDFIDFVKELVDKKEYLLDMLEFEVTETQVMSNPKKSIDSLKKIHDLGILLSVDDFGTGYSSLSYLKKLPISKLKIDKSFVDELPHNSEDVAIAKTIISLCKSLSLSVIAEGVENSAQKDFLLENGCDYIQ
ncbi:EAL domain-containing protein, partial [Sulfurimonas sp. SAG-AH-194-C21]